MHGSQEVSCGFVVAGGDGAKEFEFGKEVLNQGVYAQTAENSWKSASGEQWNRYRKIPTSVPLLPGPLIAAEDRFKAEASLLACHALTLSHELLATPLSSMEFNTFQLTFTKRAS